MNSYILKILICIFCFSFFSGASAATVNVVAKYGLTGELKGILNSVGDTHNDIDICPAVNTNANGTPGCDMDSDSGFQDGGTPDDGSDDSYTGDLIVRTHDAFEAVAGWNWGNDAGDGEEVVTIVGTLPSGTGSQFPFEWDSLPPTCDPVGSSISGDGQTITCVRRDFDTSGVGSYSEDLPFPVKVRGGAMNGEEPGDISFEISSLNATNVSDDTNNTSIIVTAAPRWNIEKLKYSDQIDYFNGTSTGYLLRYAFVTGVMEVNGTAHTAPGILGNESLGENISINVSDDISTISPNAEFIACDTTDGYAFNQPHPSYNIAFPERSVASVAPTVICTASGSVINIVASGIDATLNHIPFQAQNGSALPVTDFIASVVFFKVFVPYTDVFDGNDGIGGTADDGELDISNTVSGFDPNSQSSTSNFGGNTESTLDNTKTSSLRPFLGYGAKVFTESEGSISGLVYDGNIATVTDGIVHSRVQFQNAGVIPVTGIQLCDVFDSNYLELTPNGATTNIIDPFVSARLSGGGPVDLIVEYASSYVDDSFLLSNGGDNTSSYGSQTIGECDIENDTGSTIWYSTPAAAIADPLGLGVVTKFRVKANTGFEIPAGETLYAWSAFSPRGTDVLGNPVPVGAIMTNRLASFDDNINPNWLHFYIPRDENSSDSGSVGDRVLLTGVEARIIKDADLTTINIGDTVNFTLTGSLTNDSGTGTGQHQVYIKDLLPPGLDYITLSSTGALTGSGTSEPSVGTCSDVIDLAAPCTADHTVLIWDLGLLPVNQVIPSITYQTVAAADIPSGISENWVIIETPLDVSPADVRDDNRNVNVVVPTSLLISKTVESDPVVLRDVTPGHFRVGLRNGSAVGLTNLDVIDVLPFNGDNTLGIPFTVAGSTTTRNRVPATDFTGTQYFQSMNLTGVCTGTPTYWFTDENPETVDLAPSHTTNTTGSMPGTPTSIWCQGTATGPDAGCGFTNTTVTAVRIRGTDMPADGACFLDVFTDVAGNADGNIYTNSAGAFAGGVSNPVLSNDVTYRVIDTAPRYSLGDTIWVDTDRDGLLNNGELGYSGATVNLLSSIGVLLDAQLTTSTGGYLFTDLEDGDYMVELVVPSGYLQTVQNSGTGDILDSDFSLTDQRTGIITISGADDLTNDGGIYLIPRVSLGGTIWLDADNNTMYASGSELPFNNVTVELYNGSGTLIATGSTNATGDYLFTGLDEGDYYVSIPSSNFGSSAVLENYNSSDDTTPINDPDNDTKFEDNGLQTGTGASSVIISQTITLSEGAEPTDDGDSDANSNLTVDFGLYQTVNLGDYVWLDTNMDGIQDPTELGYSGATLNLLNASGTLLDSTTTNGSGAYLFSDLAPGDYIVEIVTPSGYTLSPTGGGTATDDSNFDRTTQRSGLVTLTSPTDDLTIDAGIFQLQNMSLGGTIWSDINDDTLFQTGSELPVHLVQVDLYEDINANGVYDSGDVFLATSNTDTAGNYLFTNLSEGNYVIVLPNSNFTTGGVLELYRSSDDTAPINDPDNDTKNEDNGLQSGTGTGVIISSQAVTLVQDTEPVTDGDSDDNSNLTIDFGVYTPLGAISGSVTEDTTGNGLGDTPISGVTLTLFADTNNDGIADGAALTTTMTNTGGFYNFPNLAFGDYVIVETQPVNLDNVSQDEGGADDDENASSIVINTLSATVGLTDTQNTDLQHEDVNNDFIEAQPAISLIKSITAVLDSNSSTRTDAGDEIQYGFLVKNTGVTILRDITVSDAKLGLTNAFCNAGPLNPGMSVTCVATGSYIIQASDELAGYVVNTASTNANSESIVDGTPGTPVSDISDTGTEPTTPGDYITVSNPETVETTDPDPSITDSDTDFTEDPTTLLLQPVGAISGTVTQDTTFDGIGDNPLVGVTLSIFIDSDGDGIADSSSPLTTTTTSSTGFYIFEDVLFGDYVIVETQPSGFDSIFQDEGGADDDENTSAIIVNTLTATVDGADPDRVDVNNDFIERRPVVSSSSSGGGGSGGGGYSSSSTSSSTPTPPSSPSTPSTPEPSPKPSGTPSNIQDKLSKYEQKIKIRKEVPVEVKGESLLKTLPKILPRTGTPISDRVSKKQDSRIDMDLPSSETFRLAGSNNADMNHWKQVLVEEDRDASKYIVVPSNGLVIPINEFAEGSQDFNTMINGREGNINPALRTGALEYPGTSTNGYGEVGNKVVFGHSSYFSNAQGRYKTHFQKIIELDAGEEIWVYEKNSDGSYKRYRYKTEKSYNTDDSDTSVLLPGEGKNLTLFTCTPIGGVEGRWIIKAKYIEEDTVITQDDGIEVLIEERDYFFYLSKEYKRMINRFIERIESIEDATERRNMYIKVYDRIEEVLPNYSDNTTITLLLEYLDYRVIQKLIEFE